MLSPTGETKKILRAALADVVPTTVLFRRDKIGFETPEQDWLKALGTRPDEWLDGLAQARGIDVDAARNFVGQASRGKHTHASQSWRLINAGRWAQIFGA